MSSEGAIRDKRPSLAIDVISQPGSHSRLKGAPVPSRDIFVFCVAKGRTAEDITSYMSDCDITARQVMKDSNDQSKFESFKLQSNHPANMPQKGVRCRNPEIKSPWRSVC